MGSVHWALAKKRAAAERAEKRKTREAKEKAAALAARTPRYAVRAYNRQVWIARDENEANRIADEYASYLNVEAVIRKHSA